jgi:hypothetical protein
MRASETSGGCQEVQAHPRILPPDGSGSVVTSCFGYLYHWMGGTTTRVAEETAWSV